MILIQKSDSEDNHDFSGNKIYWFQKLESTVFQMEKDTIDVMDPSQFMIHDQIIYDGKTAIQIPYFWPMVKIIRNIRQSFSIFWYSFASFSTQSENQGMGQLIFLQMTQNFWRNSQE